MGFLAKLARQIQNKDDDEAMDIIQRRAGLSLGPSADTVSPAPLPPPARRSVPMDENPAAIAPPVPAPTRLPMGDLGPPPGTPEYGIDQMEQLLRNQPVGDYSNATVGPDGNIAGIRYPARAPVVPPPSRAAISPEAMADPIATGPYIPPPMARVAVGENYDPHNATQRARARLRALQTSAPESKITDTGTAYEIAPPQRMGRGEAFGRGFLQLMGAGGPTLGGTAGAGIVGGIQGLISPGTVQKRQRAMETAGAENELARAQGLETQGLENERRRVQNVAQIADLQNDSLKRQLEEDEGLRVEWQQGINNIGELQKRLDQLDPQSATYGDAEKAIQQEAERLAKRTGRSVVVVPGNKKLNKLPHITIDGEVIQQQHDGSWKSIYGTRKQDNTDANADQKAEYEWQTKNVENEAKRTASQQEAQSFTATAEDHQRKVTAAAAEVSRITGLMNGIPPTIPGVGPNPEYETLKNQREQWEQTQKTEQGKMDSAYAKAREKQGEAAKYPTLPAPPKRSRQSTTTPYAGRTMSAANLARYAKDKGLTEDEARRQIEAQGVRVQ
jgi:hypothetical protein